jgi:hypothetical protein
VKIVKKSSVSQNVLKFYQQLTGEERRMPFIFDNLRRQAVMNVIFHMKTDQFVQILMTG